MGAGMGVTFLLNDLYMGYTKRKNKNDLWRTGDYHVPRLAALSRRSALDTNAIQWYGRATQ